MKTKNIIAAGLLTLSMASCKVDYLNNPSVPGEVPTSGIINQVQKNLMDLTRDEWFSGRQALLWVQYWNQTAYTEEDRFQYRETVNDGAWEDLYANAQDLRDIIEYNTNESTKSGIAAYGPNEGQIAVSRILLVYIFQNAAELWGDVPYYAYGSDDETFQALKLKYDNVTDKPVYATQEKMYASFLQELTEAVAQIESLDGDQVFYEGDNFFDGDPEQWKKFANSLKLRIATRIGDATAAQEAVTSGVMESNADNAGVTYESNATNAAPMYIAHYVDNREDFAPSYSLVEFLKGNRGEFGYDPRLEIYADKNDDGFYYGIPLTSDNGTVASFTDWSMPGAAVLAADYTEYYMEYSEVCFLLSELNGWDQTWYEAGVTASMEKWGVNADSISAFVSRLPAASEETVITQKYVALYMQPMEAWAEFRRTGYPTHWIQPGEEYVYEWKYNKKDDDGNVIETRDTSATYTFGASLDQVPSRNMYPLNEESINEDSYLAGQKSNGGDTQTTPLMWMD